MNCKDRNGMGREGCGRVAVNQWTGITYAYTIELGFGIGKKINYLPPKVHLKKGTIEPENPISDPSSTIYKGENMKVSVQYVEVY